MTDKTDFFACPYCGSPDITAGDADWDGNSVGQRVQCEVCGKEWWEVYVASHREPYMDGEFPEKPIPVHPDLLMRDDSDG